MIDYRAPLDEMRFVLTEIAGLGESADVGPGSPADFDILLNDPGRYRVVPLDRPNRTLATIIVRDPGEARHLEDERPRSSGRRGARDRGS